MTVMSIWYARYTWFDDRHNAYFNFRNCQHCVDNMEVYFSAKVINDAMLSNVIFGLLFGVFLCDRYRDRYLNLYYDRCKRNYALRVAALLAVISPLVLIMRPLFANTPLNIAKSLTLSLLVGYAMTVPM